MSETDRADEEAEKKVEVYYCRGCGLAPVSVRGQKCDWCQANESFT